MLLKKVAIKQLFGQCLFVVARIKMLLPLNCKTTKVLILWLMHCYSMHEMLAFVRKNLSFNKKLYLNRNINIQKYSVDTQNRVKYFKFL